MARQCVCKSPASTISAAGLKWEKTDCHSHPISADLLLSERGTSQRQVAWETVLPYIVGQSAACLCLWNNLTGLIILGLIC